MPWMKTYFELSSGLASTIEVPVGTCNAIKKHFERVTKKLDLEITRYGDNPPHWDRCTPPAHISNYIAGKTVLDHNKFIRQLYNDLGAWSQTPPEGETEKLTPEFANSIWYGFSLLHLTYDRWTEDVYGEEMETLFEVLQGRERDGITFGEAALTTKQAAAVIELFSVYFDKDDVRLTLPNDRDFLVTSDDYYWCPSHGAWLYEDVEEDEEDNIVCPAEGCAEVIG